MVGQAEIERFSSIQMRLYSIFFFSVDDPSTSLVNHAEQSRCRLKWWILSKKFNLTISINRHTHSYERV